MSSTKFVFLAHLSQRLKWTFVIVHCLLCSITFSHFQLFRRNHCIDSDKSLQEASTQRPQPGLYFSCRSVIQDRRPGPWLAETFFDFFSATAEQILTKLDRKEVLNILYQVCVFRTDWSSKMAILASWFAKTLVDFFSATAEWILTKLDRKQVLNILYQVCVFV